MNPNRRSVMSRTIVSLGLFAIAVAVVGAVLSYNAKSNQPATVLSATTREKAPKTEEQNEEKKENKEQAVKPAKPEPPKEDHKDVPKNDGTKVQERKATASQDPPFKPDAPPKVEAATVAANPSVQKSRPEKPMDATPPAGQVAGRPRDRATAPVSTGSTSGDPYDVRFDDDSSLGKLVKATKAWAYACPGGGGSLYLVPVAVEGSQAGPTEVADKCDATTRARHHLRALQRPTTELLSALKVDPTGFDFWIQLDKPVSDAIDELRSQNPTTATHRPLIELDGDGNARIINPGPRLAVQR